MGPVAPMALYWALWPSTARAGIFPCYCPGRHLPLLLPGPA